MAQGELQHIVSCILITFLPVILYHITALVHGVLPISNILRDHVYLFDVRSFYLFSHLSF